MSHGTGVIMEREGTSKLQRIRRDFHHFWRVYWKDIFNLHKKTILINHYYPHLKRNKARLLTVSEQKIYYRNL